MHRPLLWTEAAPADVSVAKAGKRMRKRIKEATEKKPEKEARKEEGTLQPSEIQRLKTTRKGPNIPSPSTLWKLSQKLPNWLEQVEKDKVYNLAGRLNFMVKTNPTKFDASVEIHVRLADPHH